MTDERGATKSRNWKTNKMPERYLNRKKRFESVDPDMTAVTSGGLLGLDDELWGAGNAIAGAVKKGTLSDIGADYKYVRDLERERQAQAAKANPDRYQAINTVSSLPASLLTPGKIPAQIAMGATKGFGNSDRLNEGLAADVALGGITEPIFSKLKTGYNSLKPVVQGIKTIGIPQTVDIQAKLKALKKLAGEES